MLSRMDPRTRLSLLMGLIALHSLLVGIGLILLPADVMSRFFGFHLFGEKFFPVQGGVFHLVMAVAYAMAALHPVRDRALLVFSAAAKGMAFCFLLLYFMLVDPVPLVLLSGIGDGVMGALIVWADRSRARAELIGMVY